MGTIFKESRKLSPREAELVRLYEYLGKPVDTLPYTAEFEQICMKVYGKADRETQAAAFHRLLNLRKSRRLPRMGRLFAERTPLAEDEHDLLSELIARSAGTIGHRDALPYTPEFDAILTAFNEQTMRNLDANTLWRMIARVAKWPTRRIA